MDIAASINSIVQTEPVIDRTIIDRYRQRRAGLVTTLVEAYLAEAPRFFQELRSAVTAGNLAAVRSAAHGLKSCSFNLGAVRLAKICQETEHAAADHSLEQVQFALSQVGPALFDAEEALKSERTRPSR